MSINTITNSGGRLESVTGRGVDALRLKALILALRFRRDVGYEMDPRFNARTYAKKETGLTTNNLDKLIEAVATKMNAAIVECEIVNRAAARE